MEDSDVKLLSKVLAVGVSDSIIRRWAIDHHVLTCVRGCRVCNHQSVQM